MALTPAEQKELQELEALVAKVQAEQPKPSLTDRVVQGAKAAYPYTLPGMMNTYNDAVRKGANVAGEKTAEFLGEKGVNPNIAAAAGTAIQMTPDIASAAAMGGVNPGAGVKATGPFTASFKDPSTAAPGALERAGKALGATKTAARAGEDLAEASRLRSLLLKGKGGIVKVAEEGKKAMDTGRDASVTQLLAFREGLGKAQKLGGSFANDYKIAFDKATDALTKKAPDLMKALQKYNLAALAKEGEEFSVPFLETAINPAIGAVKAGYKMSQMAPVRSAAGAATNMAVRTVGAGSGAMMSAYDRVFNRKSKKKGK